MKPIESTVPVGEVVDLNSLEDGRVVDLGSVQVGFAQVDVQEKDVAPPETAVPEEQAAETQEQANSKLKSLLEDVQRGYAEDLLTDEEIGDYQGQTNRVVAVEVYDVDDRRIPFARFKATAPQLDDAQVHRLAEVVEETPFVNARWVVSEIWAHWKDGERRVVLLAKRL